MLLREPSIQRQQRLLRLMAEQRLDAVVVGWPGHVYYFSTFLTGWLHQSAFILYADGRSTLITANAPAEGTAATHAVAYPAQLNSTQRPDQAAVVATAVEESLQSHHVQTVAVDTSMVSAALMIRGGRSFTSIDAALWQLRRIKDADELALMQTAINCTERMYRRARDLIEPGVQEIDVYNQLHAAAVEVAGEPLSAYLGNDYQCGTRGGAARANRSAKDGELYILDLGPCYRGYFADNARTIAVNRKPTDHQHRAWETIMEAHALIAWTARPGVRCQDLFNAVDHHFQQSGFGHLPHHLGHGVGLQPHEFPHLNLNWDDVLMEGEVFSAEPGLYSDALNGGIRIENQYLVTADGVDNLTKDDRFPTTLA